MKYALVETALGVFGLGWTEAGISCVALPGESADDAERRMLELGGEADEPRRAIADIEERIVAYAEGAPDAFQDVAIDLTGVPELNRRIYEHIRELAWGETTTYGAIARWLGDVALSRAVGAAMGANPIPLIVPCHRVLAADGRTGGFSSPRGVQAKMEMLALEKAASPTGQFSFGF